MVQCSEGTLCRVFPRPAAVLLPDSCVPSQRYLMLRASVACVVCHGHLPFSLNVSEMIPCQSSEVSSLSLFSLSKDLFLFLSFYTLYFQS